MNNKQPNEKETIQLLQFLLDEEYAEKEILGRELHSNKGLLITIAHKIDFSGVNKKSNTDLTVEEERKELFNECSHNLQTIQNKLYSVTLTYSGILLGLKQYILDYKKQYLVTHKVECPFVVHLDYNKKHIDKLRKINDIQIYKTCTEILDLLFISGPDAIEIKMTLENKNLEIEISAKTKKPSIKKTEVVRRINLIKAKLVWGNAVIATETNWRNKFKFTINTKR